MVRGRKHVTVRHFNLLLAAMVRAGQNEAAERVWRDMQVAEVPPNTHTYSRLIRWRCNMGELSLAHELLREQLQSRLALKNGTYGCLIDKYYRESNYDACRQVLLDVAQAGFTPDDVALVRTIQASCAQGDVATAVWMLQQMRDLGFKPRELAHEAVVIGCCNADDTEHAESVLADMIAAGYQPRPPVYVALMRAYQRASMLAAMQSALDRLLALPTCTPDFALNASLAMVRECAKRGDLAGVHSWFDRMRRGGLQLDTAAYTLELQAVLVAHGVDVAEAVLLHMIDSPSSSSSDSSSRQDDGSIAGHDLSSAHVQSLLPSISRNVTPHCSLFAVLFEYLLSADGPSHGLERALALRAKMAHLGIKPERSMMVQLLYEYARRGMADEARVHLQEMSAAGIEADAQIYDAMVLVCIRRRQYDRAVAFLERMVAEHLLEPLPFNRLLQTCGMMADLPRALSLLRIMNQAGVPYNYRTYQHIIETYLTCRDHEGARLMLRNMIQAGLAPMGSLRDLLTKHGL